jgi:DNA-binding transcriptional MerR regulator
VRSGELAGAAGVNVQTLRYYERLGLLPEPPRSPGGHREYDRDALLRLRAVKAAQRLGFRLADIGELLDLRAHRRRPGLRERTRERLSEVDARIADLHAVRAALVDVLDAGCADLVACATTPGCPIPFAEAARP